MIDFTKRLQERHEIPPPEDFDEDGRYSPASAPDWTDDLSEEQLSAARGVIQAVHDHERSVSLIGYAGTGKTLLTSRIVSALELEGKCVTVTAPTHKAAGQLYLRLGRPVNTLHSALGLSEHIDHRTGKVSFRPSDKGLYENSVMDSDVLVVDESSMVGDDLLNYVKDALPASATVVWVGDDAQLPPVGEKECPALRSADVTFRLEQVRRHGGDILREAQRIREARTTRGGIPRPRGGDGVVVYGPGEGWLDRAVDAIREHGESEVRILCWTNKMVRAACDQVHASLYGAEAPPWVSGQRIVALEPVLAGGSLSSLMGQSDRVLHTSEEARIVSAAPSEVEGVPCWDVTATNGAGFRFRIDVLTDSGKDAYDARCRDLRQTALSVPEDDKQARKKAWRDFYGFSRAFAKVERVYAMTVHKSQGSTYRHVWVNLKDIIRNPDRDEMLRCYYTAITRAAESVHILM